MILRTVVGEKGEIMFHQKRGGSRRCWLSYPTKWSTFAQLIHLFLFRKNRLFLGLQENWEGSSGSFRIFLLPSLPLPPTPPHIPFPLVLIKTFTWMSTLRGTYILIPFNLSRVFRGGHFHKAPWRGAERECQKGQGWASGPFPLKRWPCPCLYGLSGPCWDPLHTTQSLRKTLI